MGAGSRRLGSTKCNSFAVLQRRRFSPCGVQLRSDDRHSRMACAGMDTNASAALAAMQVSHPCRQPCPLDLVALRRSLTSWCRSRCSGGGSPSLFQTALSSRQALTVSFAGNCTELSSNVEENSARHPDMKQDNQPHIVDRIGRETEKHKSLSTVQRMTIPLNYCRRYIETKNPRRAHRHLDSLAA